MKSVNDSGLKLDTLKRSELQKLAKKYGIKANLRNAKLIEEITKKLSDCSTTKQLGSPSTKRRSHSRKKSLSPNISSVSPDVVTLESISPPPLEELSFDDLNVAEKTSFQAKKSKSKTGSRSSSRTRSGKTKEDSPNDSIGDVKPDNVTRRAKAESTSSLRASRSRSSSQKRSGGKTPTSMKKKTPTNKTESRKAVNTKTFSVPKNRALSRISTSAKEKSSPVKKASKRKSSVVEQPPQAKRGRTRKSKEKNDDDKEVTIRMAEKSVTRTSGLRSFNAKNIPSFAVKGLTVTKVSSTPTQHMFEKLHQKNFNKMESIDDYQKRKEERIEKLFGSNKKQAQINRLAKPKTPSIAKPVTRPKPTFMSPKTKLVPPTKKSSKTALFKPTVTKVADINMNFGTKRSKLPTPKKVTVSFAKSPEKKISNVRTPAQNQSLQTKRKSGTPFRQNTSVVNTPQSAKKNVFNLQESLKKPLSWKPHKGPLKKYEDPAKKPNLKERAKTLKQPKLKSREARRAQAKEARATSRSDRMMKKRGLK